MKRMSVKQLRGGVTAAIYLLKSSEPFGPSMALKILERLSKNGKDKIHRKAHTRLQNGKRVRVSAS